MSFKKQETKLGNIDPRNSKIKKSLLSTSKTFGKMSVFGKSFITEEVNDTDEELDEVYDFGSLATADSPEKLLQSMSFNVDTALLYEIEKTCVLSQANRYCPILLQVNDKELVKEYGGEYVIQVWSDEKQLLYEKVRESTIYSWSLINNFFVFRDELSETIK